MSTPAFLKIQLGRSFKAVASGEVGGCVGVNDAVLAACPR